MNGQAQLHPHYAHAGAAPPPPPPPPQAHTYAAAMNSALAPHRPSHTHQHGAGAALTASAGGGAQLSVNFTTLQPFADERIELPPSAAHVAPTVLIDPVVEAIRKAFPERFLGTWLYTHSYSSSPSSADGSTDPPCASGVLFPPLEHLVNGTLHVRIPAYHLSYNNPAVRRAAVWGTAVYTDDSDVVAMLLHAGKVTLPDPVPENTRSAPFHAPGVTDLLVSLRVYPRLEHYPGTLANRIRSRAWVDHDGVSLVIEKVTPLQRGEALRAVGRRTRKLLLGQRLRMHAWAVRRGRLAVEDLGDARVGFTPEGMPALVYTPDLAPTLSGRAFAVQQEHHDRYIFDPVRTKAGDTTYALRRVALVGDGDEAKATLVITDAAWSCDVVFRDDGIEVTGSVDVDGVTVRKRVFVRVDRVWFVHSATDGGKTKSRPSSRSSGGEQQPSAATASTAAAAETAPPTVPEPAAPAKDAAPPSSSSS
ncbi:hypothetical protein H9P43_002389 [Blastocladiella emersonii ATCC 22665]|nr:hypothetical protein H9P43_002389 [Blastocladiella emersonii ATCC 22665]